MTLKALKEQYYVNSDCDVEITKSNFVSVGFNEAIPPITRRVGYSDNISELQFAYSLVDYFETNVELRDENEGLKLKLNGKKNKLQNEKLENLKLKLQLQQKDKVIKKLLIKNKRLLIKNKKLEKNDVKHQKQIKKCLKKIKERLKKN